MIGCPSRCTAIDMSLFGVCWRAAFIVEWCVDLAKVKMWAKCGLGAGVHAVHIFVRLEAIHLVARKWYSISIRVGILEGVQVQHW